MNWLEWISLGGDGGGESWFSSNISARVEFQVVEPRDHDDDEHSDHVDDVHDGHDRADADEEDGNS